MYRSTRALRSLVPLTTAAALVALTGCSSADLSASSTDSDPTGSVSENSAGDATDVAIGVSGASDGGFGAVGELDSTAVHEIEVEFDDDDFASMLETYSATSEKEWIEATVTIDGTTFEQVGLRLKGNSSLRGVSADADPVELPWLIRLDKFVDGQHLDGLTDLVVRSNNTETALNEAVALELLELAGLASEDAIATAFSVNGGDATLRLVIDNPDDAWMAEWFDEDGALYKAESTGDYSYRGDDPDAYDEVFDQEAGKDNADLEPLLVFLEFVNEADDATFAAELDEYLDVDAFATYLAMQDLIDNFDDIDGPGNNSYLYWDADTGRFTVVPWDHNLAFGVENGGAARGGVPGEIGARPGGAPVGDAPGGAPAEAPDGVPDAAPDEAPADGPVGVPGERPDVAGGPPAANGEVAGPGQGGVAGAPNGSNVLAERFRSVDEFQALYEQQLATLRSALFDSGVADDVLSTWVEVVSSSGLIDPMVVEQEAASIATAFG